MQQATCRYKALSGIDSGVDYTHPALGGCFGKGCKVAYGYDLVGNNYNGSTSSIEESDDPIDNCPANSSNVMQTKSRKLSFSTQSYNIDIASATGHGTFVSGIIGAEDLVYVSSLSFALNAMKKLFD